MSIDTVAVSMLGPNEASRSVQQPVARKINLEKDIDKSKVQIRGSQYMQNSFNDLADLMQKFNKNVTVSMADKQCQEFIKLHLLP